MLHWPLVRFGAASVLIGRPIEESLPFTAALGNQLLDNTRVVLGSDLETIGLVTRVDPGSDPDAIARIGTAIGKASGAAAEAWWQRWSDATTAFDATVLFRARGVAYSIAYDTTGFTDVLDSVELPAAVVAQLGARLGPLADSIERVTYDQIEGLHRIRFDAVTDDIPAISAVLDRSRIADAQRSYFTNSAPVWTLNSKRIAVRVATGDNGPIDQVGVVFTDVAGENMMRAWKTFRARADFDTRLGTFVGTIGTEIADRFELRFYRTGEPHLEATFTPSSAPFKRTITA
jgi:hypothetical protein